MNNRTNYTEHLNLASGILNDSSLSDRDKVEHLVAAFSDIQEEGKCPDISITDLAEGIDALKESFWEFVKIEDQELFENQELVDINEKNLAEVVSRTYKRKVYYRYFHDIKKASELKEVALNSFWIIKLKPFTVLKDDSCLRLSVNEKFALNLILSQIQYLLSIKNKDFVIPDNCFIQDTLYSFKYRDLTKEAIILFVDSLASSYGITIDSWK